MTKIKVTLSIDENTWKDFQVYCIKSTPRKVASHEIESFMKDEVQYD